VAQAVLHVLAAACGACYCLCLLLAANMQATAQTAEATVFNSVFSI